MSWETWYRRGIIALVKKTTEWISSMVVVNKTSKIQENASYTLNSESLKIDPDKVRARVEIPGPSDVKGLQRLCMVISPNFVHTYQTASTH